MKPMTPKISVSPALTKKSSIPSSSPLRSCTRKSGTDISSSPVRLAMPALSVLLHRALFGEFVALHRQHVLDDLRLILAVITLGRLHQVVILDRELVRVELELTTHRMEVGLLQGSTECFLVRHVAMHGADGAVDQHGRIIGMGGEVRRYVAVGLLEIRHELLVRRIVEVRRPIGAAEKAEGVILQAGQCRLIDSK